MFKTFGRFVAVAAASVAIMLGFGGTAQAAYAPLPLPPNSVGASQLAPNSVGWADWGSALRGEWNTNKARLNAVEIKANQALSAPEYGKADPEIKMAPKVIENLGGKYFGDTNDVSDDRYTKLGSFVLTPGVWMVNTQVVFHRNAAGVEGTMPQVGLRIGQDQTASGDAKWGKPVGTVGGVAMSPASGHDLFASTQARITITEDTEVVAYGFGYNWDQGTAGSGQIAAQVTLNPVLVG